MRLTLSDGAAELLRSLPPGRQMMLGVVDRRGRLIELFLAEAPGRSPDAFPSHAAIARAGVIDPLVSEGFCIEVDAGELVSFSAASTLNVRYAFDVLPDAVVDQVCVTLALPRSAAYRRLT